MDLSADSIQGVYFTTPGPTQQDALKIWGHIFPGDSPDGFNRNQASPTLQSNANGVRNNHNVNVIVQVGRIDIVLNPEYSAPPTLPTAPPRITDVEKGVDEVKNYLRRVVAHQPALRLAVVLDLAKTVDAAAIPEAMAEMVGPGIFPPNVLDAIFQYNSRRHLTTSPETIVNRLCTWSSGQVGFISAPVPPIPFQPQSLVMTDFVGLKIDVNTLNQRPNLPIDSVTEIIEEIASEVIAIRSEGKIRLIQNEH